jgi:hypothetical protein
MAPWIAYTAPHKGRHKWLKHQEQNINKQQLLITADIKNIMDKQEQQSSRDFSNRRAPAKAVMPGASQTRKMDRDPSKMGRDPSNSRGLANRNSISFQQKQTYQEHYGLATAAGMPAKAGNLAKKGCQQLGSSNRRDATAADISGT